MDWIVVAYREGLNSPEKVYEFKKEEEARSFAESLKSMYTVVSKVG